jgi:hypothetical protein
MSDKQHDDSNKGAIWKNDKKEKDTHPDWKGSINVEGVDYWLSGWSRKQGDNPKSPSVRFSVQRKDAVHGSGIAQAKATISNARSVNNAINGPDGFADLEDDIPW